MSLHISLQPLPTPISWYFFVQPIAAECWRGRGGKLQTFENSWKKTHYLMNTLYVQLIIINNLSVRPSVRQSVADDEGRKMVKKGQYNNGSISYTDLFPPSID